jgi:hypothetical protein
LWASIGDAFGVVTVEPQSHRSGELAENGVEAIFRTGFDDRDIGVFCKPFTSSSGEFRLWLN